jgi:ATP-dependent helicase/nuclease subunit A
MSSLGTPAGLTIPDATRLSQRRAADPAASAWVSANAGAGKTKVLTDRVIRLLLEGVPPGRILCLTFTKAAAAEMTIRVFRQLGAWVTLDDAALADTISDLVGERPDRARVLSARRLFARAIETPGGLKIETIHAFCERILHLVPFEANVPARFAVLDDAQSGELLAEARERILAQAAGRSGAGEALARALDITFTAASGDTLTAVLSAAVNDARVPGTERDRIRAVARLRAALGLDADETPDTVRREILESGLGAAELVAIADQLARSKSSSDCENARLLREAATAPTLESRADVYLSVFLTVKSRKRKNVCTKGMGEALCVQLSAEAERLERLADRLRSARALERTDALFTLAGAIRRVRDGLKTRLGALDFDDLIAKTLELLSKGSSAWVLYKLDRGVDHVLVDEAQDTNPDQWRILRHLTEEFTAAMASRDGRAARCSQWAIRSSRSTPSRGPTRAGSRTAASIGASARTRPNWFSTTSRSTSRSGPRRPC